MTILERILVVVLSIIMTGAVIVTARVINGKEPFSEPSHNTTCVYDSYEVAPSEYSSYVSRVVAMPYEPKFAVVNGMVAFKVAGVSQLETLTNFGRISNAPLFAGGYEFIGNDMVVYHTHDGGIGYVTMQNIWKGTTKVPPVFWVVIQPK